MQAKRPERESYDIVIAEDLRPAGNGKDCFYCGSALGGPHQEDCVIRQGAGWCLVAIRKNATGEVRMYRYDMEWQDSSAWFWTDGNYSCDCNRELSWVRAGGPGPEDDPHWNDLETSCGDGRFSALYADLPDGTRVPLDEQPGPATGSEP